VEIGEIAKLIRLLKGDREKDAQVHESGSRDGQVRSRISILNGCSLSEKLLDKPQPV
jgi:hypothetical protein